MGTRKTKTEAVEVATSTAVQPEETSAVPQPTEQPITGTDEPTLVEQEQPKYSVVVCAYTGTEDLVRKVWEQMTDEPVVIFSVDDGDYDVRMIATQIIAASDVEDNFVLVMPNTVPCSRISKAELMLPVVYVDKAGKEHYAHRLPMAFSKSNLVELYNSPDYSADEEGDEQFMRDYAERFYTRPVHVSHNFGNYVTLVMRGNPCNAVVAEGIRRRKFICANAVGFEAIKTFIEALLAK